MDMGLGKTITTLALFHKLKAKNPRLRLLVVCPKVLVKSAWEEDVKKFTQFSISYYKKYKDQDILTINFEALIRGKQKQFILDKLAEGPWMCAIDESSKLKNHKSKITKTLLELAPKFVNRVILSANPTPNTEMEFFSQLNFLHKDYLGKNFFQYRSYFFHLQRGGQIIGQGGFIPPSALKDMFKKGFKYTVNKERYPVLLERLKPVCFWRKKKDCLDLPEQIDVLRKVELGASEKRAYKDMKQSMIAEIKEEFVVANVALTKIMKLRQITSGFAYDEDRNAIALDEKTKLKELGEILEELGDEQAIIWINFKEEQRVILEMLGDNACVAGDENFDAFRGGEHQYLVLNPKSCAHGLTFVNCSYQIFYSMSYSYEEYAQCKGRIHRIGQNKNCTYIHILADGTIDMDLLDVVQKKKSIEDTVFNFLRGK